MQIDRNRNVHDQRIGMVVIRTVSPGRPVKCLIGGDRESILRTRSFFPTIPASRFSVTAFNVSGDLVKIARGRLSGSNPPVARLRRRFALNYPRTAPCSIVFSRQMIA